MFGWRKIIAPETDRDVHLRSLLFQLSLVLSGVVVYSNIFGAPFVYDDLTSIVNNEKIRAIDSLWPLFEIEYRTIFSGRFVGYLTFALNYQLHGLEAAGYHLFNLMLHLINGILLYRLLLITGRRYRGAANIWRSSAQDPVVLAWLAALLFLIHPVQSQAVTYTVQRFVSLATLFTFLTLLAYIAARQSGQGGIRTTVFYLLSLSSAYLAMKSKELAYTLPFLIALYEWAFPSEGRRRWVFWPGYALLWLPILLTYVSPDASLSQMVEQIDHNSRVLSTLSRSEYLLTQFRVIIIYIRLIFCPVNQRLIYDLEPSSSLFEPTVIASLITLIALAGGALLILIRSPQTLNSPGADSAVSSTFRDYYLRLVGFGVCWFFIALSIESSIFPIGRLLYEHRLYLPSAGAFTAIVAALLLLREGDYLVLIRRRGELTKLRIEKALLLIALLILMVATYQRNEVWASAERFWQNVIARAPHYAGGYVNLGLYYHRQGDNDRAIAIFQDGIRNFRVRPFMGEPYRDLALLHSNLSSAFLLRKESSAANYHYRRAMELKPDLLELGEKRPPLK